MLDRIKIVAEPVFKANYVETGTLIIKWEISIDGQRVCVDTNVPRGDLIHSAFDYVWENAKRKFEIELEKNWPVKAIL